jgi:hypothetical protein
MAEPITTTSTLAGAATIATAGAVVVPALTIFGVATGLRADMLIAGFAGSLVGIVLLNTVPSGGDTWRAMVDTTFRRMATAVASALAAGYLTPLVLLLANVPDSLQLGAAFAAGGGAQRILLGRVHRFTNAAGPPGPPGSSSPDGGAA